MAEDFLSFKDVLKELKLDEEALNRMVSWGELRAYRQQDKIRFKKNEIDNIKKDRGGEEDFLTFADVLKELKISEAELKKMISEGSIRAFRSKDKIKFKRDEVDGMKKEQVTEATVVLPAEKESGLPPESIEPELPTTTTEEPLLLSEDTDQVTTPLAPPGDAEETFVDEVSVIEETVTEDIVPTFEEKEAPPSRRPSVRKPSAVKKSKRVQVEIAPVKLVPVSPILIVILALILFVMVFVGSFLSDSARIMGGTSSKPLGLTSEIGQTIVNIFGMEYNLEKQELKED